MLIIRFLTGSTMTESNWEKGVYEDLSSELAMSAQILRLQGLVSELLATNQRLRINGPVPKCMQCDANSSKQQQSVAARSKRLTVSADRNGLTPQSPLL